MDRLLPGLTAVLLGIPVLVAVFTPIVALEYRRRGGFSGVRLTAWIMLLFYVLGLWAYTLLPLPEPGSFACVGAELDPTAAFRDILRDQADGGSLIGNPAFQQVALNVLLFVPLGVFVRLLFGRGVVVSTIAGFVVSLSIELTQLTGLWGVYECAYRVFDTADLLVNTLGAVVGSLAAWPVARRLALRAQRHANPDASSGPVSAARRLTGMVVDALAVWLTAAALAIGVRLAVLVLSGHDAMMSLSDEVVVWTTSAAVALQLVAVLSTGATIGEHAVLVEPVETRTPRWMWRLVRFAVGIGGWTALGALPSPWSLAASVLALASVVAVFTTDGHRGLAQVAAGMRVRGLVRDVPDASAHADASDTTRA
ncbi:VanZ family protein [Agromyces protaetiae]|uniref:VanZ family protein n=1 Tax=Agromyces protaetiae TaxID=2509455 RepID=A0A4P6FEH0_9MICO|nr:VanZ family protein [Agromyces protaetiae]QAY74650.1 VanZ family protein [Agromyces protaetiae]